MDRGCELVQGYLLAVPQGPDEISTMLREHGALIDRWPSTGTETGRTAA